MHPDLMGTSGFQFQADMGEGFAGMRRFKMRDGRISVNGIGYPFDGGTLLSSDGDVNGAGESSCSENKCFVGT